MFRDDEACTFGPPRSSASYDMAIFGDSHADHYTPAMSVLARAGGDVGPASHGRQMPGAARLRRDHRYARHASGLSLAARSHGPLRGRQPAIAGGRSGAPLVLLHRQHNLAGRGADLSPGLEARCVIGAALARRCCGKAWSKPSISSNGVAFAWSFWARSLSSTVTPSDASPLPSGKDCKRKAAGFTTQEVQERIGTMNGMLADLARRRKNVSFFSPLATMCDEVGAAPLLTAFTCTEIACTSIESEPSTWRDRCSPCSSRRTRESTEWAPTAMRTDLGVVNPETVYL